MYTYGTPTEPQYNGWRKEVARHEIRGFTTLRHLSPPVNTPVRIQARTAVICQVGEPPTIAKGFPTSGEHPENLTTNPRTSSLCENQGRAYWKIHGGKRYTSAAKATLDSERWHLWVVVTSGNSVSHTSKSGLQHPTSEHFHFTYVGDNPWMLCSISLVV